MVTVLIRVKLQKSGFEPKFSKIVGFKVYKAKLKNKGLLSFEAAKGTPEQLDPSNIFKIEKNKIWGKINSFVAHPLPDTWAKKNSASVDWVLSIGSCVR